MFACSSLIIHSYKSSHFNVFCVLTLTNIKKKLSGETLQLGRISTGSLAVHITQKKTEQVLNYLLPLCRDGLNPLKLLKLVPFGHYFYYIKCVLYDLNYKLLRNFNNEINCLN